MNLFTETLDPDAALPTGFVDSAYVVCGKPMAFVVDTQVEVRRCLVDVVGQSAYWKRIMLETGGVNTALNALTGIEEQPVLASPLDHALAVSYAEIASRVRFTDIPTVDD